MTNLQITDPGPQTVKEGGSVSLQIQAQGTAGATLSYSASGLPSGLSIDSTTGLISGTLAAGTARPDPYLSTVAASSGNGYQSVDISWTVTHVALANPGNQINAAGDTVSLALQGTPSDGSPLTYSATGLPSGLTVDSSTGVISGTISGSTGSPYTVAATVTDGGNSASQTFTWYVTNGQVMVTNPGAQTNAEGASVSLPISAQGGNGSLTYSAVGLPAGLSINSSTGVISGTVAYTAAETNDGQYTVSVMADDGQGHTGSTYFAWTVTDANATPTVSDPGNQTNAEGDLVNLQIKAWFKPG